MNYGRQQSTGRTVHLMPDKFEPISKGHTTYFIEPTTDCKIGDVVNIRELTYNQSSTATGFDLEVGYGWKWLETGRVIEARITHISTNFKGIADRYQVVSFTIIYQYDERKTEGNHDGQGVPGAPQKQSTPGGEHWELIC